MDLAKMDASEGNEKSEKLFRGGPSLAENQNSEPQRKNGHQNGGHFFLSLQQLMSFSSHRHLLLSVVIKQRVFS
jgi:hypothetical protein